MNIRMIAAGLIAFSLVACNNNPPTAPTNPTFTANLSASHEVAAPAVPADYKGTGSSTVTWDGKNVTLMGSYSGLTGAATMAHIHVGEVGVAGPVVCPLKVTESATAGTGTLATDAACALNEDKLKAGMYYVNIHTAANPAGELRGQLFRK